jgi:hypothetical protein
MGLVIELANTNAPRRGEEVLTYLLEELSIDYDPFVNSMTTKIKPLSLDDVFTHLVAFEAHQL